MVKLVFSKGTLWYSACISISYIFCAFSLFCWCRKKGKKEGDLRFDRELNHQIFMVLLSMHEMWNVHHQKNGVMNIRCDFFFFFMLHLWAVCQKMPVRPSHSAEDKLNLSKNCKKKTKQWMLQHEDFKIIRQRSNFSAIA